MNDILLTNTEKLKRESVLDYNVPDDMVRTAVKYIQDLIADRVTGHCLFDKLGKLICSGQINDVRYNCYKKLLDDYLFPVFVYGVPSELTIPLAYKVRNAGVVRNISDELVPASADEVVGENNWFVGRRDFYMERAAAYLERNSDSFPERDQCDCPRCKIMLGRLSGDNADNDPQEKS